MHDDDELKQIKNEIIQFIKDRHGFCYHTDFRVSFLHHPSFSIITLAVAGLIDDAIIVPEYVSSPYGTLFTSGYSLVTLKYLWRRHYKKPDYYTTQRLK